VLDPLAEDLDEYIEWMTASVLKESLSQEKLLELKNTLGAGKTYAGSLMALKAELKDEKVFLKADHLDFDQVKAVINRFITPPIEETRRKQTLLALLNCTRRDLIPDSYIEVDFDAQREHWKKELEQM